MEHNEEVHEKVQSTFDIFFGVEHRMKKMEEQFNKESEARMEICS